MNSAAWGAIAALTVFALSATFYAGVLHARMSAIEQWRLELRADWLQLMASVRRIEIRLGVREE